MNATFPHVELLPRRLERGLQLLELTRTPERTSIIRSGNGVSPAFCIFLPPAWRRLRQVKYLAGLTRFWEQFCSRAFVLKVSH